VAVKIRVKERIRTGDASRATFGRPERAILILVGACLGLGLGYLAAGWIASWLRPPISKVRAESTVQPTPVDSTRGPLPATTADLEFDLPTPGR